MTLHSPKLYQGLNQRIGSFQFQGYRGWNQITKVLGSDEVAYTKGTLQKGKVNALSLYVEIAVSFLSTLIFFAAPRCSTLLRDNLHQYPPILVSIIDRHA